MFGWLEGKVGTLYRFIQPKHFPAIPMISNARSAYQVHDHQRCIDAALNRARQCCDAANARLTPIRETVLLLIWKSHKPLGAYSIVEQLPALTGKRIQPPSVYRAIEFLLELRLIHRIPSLNAFIGCPFPGSDHSDVFMVCRQCGSAAEVSADNLNQLIAETTHKAGFQLESQTVEVSGLCLACNPEEPC